MNETLSTILGWWGIGGWIIVSSLPKPETKRSGWLQLLFGGPIMWCLSPIVSIAQHYHKRGHEQRAMDFGLSQGGESYLETGPPPFLPNTKIHWYTDREGKKRVDELLKKEYSLRTCCESSIVIGVKPPSDIYNIHY